MRWLSKRVQQSVSASTVFPVYMLHISVNEFMKVSVVPLGPLGTVSPIPSKRLSHSPVSSCLLILLSFPISFTQYFSYIHHVLWLWGWGHHYCDKAPSTVIAILLPGAHLKSSNFSCQKSQTSQTPTPFRSYKMISLTKVLFLGETERIEPRWPAKLSLVLNCRKSSGSMRLWVMHRSGRGFGRSSNGHSSSRAWIHSEANYSGRFIWVFGKT